MAWFEQWLAAPFIYNHIQLGVIKNLQKTINEAASVADQGV